MSSQFYLALAIHEQFEELGAEYESWRCCAGVLHYCAVKDDAVVEASVYIDEDPYMTLLEYLDEPDDEPEDVTDEESESESEEEEEFIDDGPYRKRRRKEV
jgi:hypothetical protein